MRLPRLFIILVALTSASRPALAQPPASPEPKVSISGYIQPQWEFRSREGETHDHASIRRAVVALDITLTDNWHAELQTDFGPLTDDDDRVIVKNALITYAGWEQTRGIVVMVGNQKVPFSRALFASSSRRGLIERPFTGDRAYGSPGRALSIRADGWHRRRSIFWSASLAETRHSADPFEIRLDGVAGLGDRGTEGHLVAGRFEFHPLGEVPREHGDFDRGPLRVTVATAAYAWRSDGDTRLAPADVEASRVSGLEVSGALRARGLSIDAEFEHVSAGARRPFLDDSWYMSGDTHVRKGSIEAGYLILREHLEALAGVDMLDAPRFDTSWRRFAGGLNWYVSRHRLKFSFMHRESFNDLGVNGARSRATYVQTQIAF